jgi:hypothetical protein
LPPFIANEDLFAKRYARIREGLGLKDIASSASCPPEDAP